jgi:hypothetical protein
MHMKYFGDSYDLVKLSFIGWLRRFGDWSVHPMLTEKATPEEIRAFERFLGTPLISTEILTTATDREKYLSSAYHAGNLFLDPDTGLRMKSTNGVRAPEYLFSSELVRIVASRPKALTLVFDQSLPRGGEPAALLEKLKLLLAEGIHSFAYVSHACFVVAGHDRTLVEKARAHVQSESKLPASRFLAPTGA